MTDEICRTVMVEVTAADIQYGERESTTSCPIALALCRQYPEANVIVERHYIFFSFDERYKRIQLPKAAESFISSFDDDEPVGPIGFPLLIPESAFFAAEAAS